MLGGTKLVRTRPEKPRFQPYDDSVLVSLDDYAPLGAVQMLRTWRLGREIPHMRDVKYDAKIDRVAFPVWSPLRDLRGYVLRTWDANRKPKVLTARMVDTPPFISWVRPKEAKQSIICVEDMPSAMRVCEAGYDAVALLGNTPSDEAMAEIAAEAAYLQAPVVWALDPDATAQAIRLHRSYGMRGNSSVLVLEKDFKNMTPEEVNECLMSVP